MRYLTPCKLFLVAVFCLESISGVRGGENDLPRVATFQSDITPPLGEPMFSCDSLKTVEQPLLAKGIIIESGADRYVLCALDWCELCNCSYDSLRKRIAEAAGTEPSRVAIQTVHQHTAPLIDREAKALLPEKDSDKIHISLKVLDEIEARLVEAVKQSTEKFEPFDQVGTGQAKVERVASSRRPVDEQGIIRPRMSRTDDPVLQALPEGLIDPYVKTITLAREEKPLVRLHYYATHPQSLYGDGRASSDFPGDAREALQQKEGVFQIYFTGCGGDITAGKYNNGSRECREGLAERLLAGMEASVAATTLQPVGPIDWKVCPVLFPRRTDPGFNAEDALARTKDDQAMPVLRLYGSALRVVFHRRSELPIELSCLQLGDVHIVHLPGEPLIEFQFYAQGLKPDAFVAVAGYGDCGTGYICPAKAYEEGGYEPTDANITPESEALVKKAIAQLLGIE